MNRLELGAMPLATFTNCGCSEDLDYTLAQAQADVDSAKRRSLLEYPPYRLAAQAWTVEVDSLATRVARLPVDRLGLGLDVRHKDPSARHRGH